MSSYFFLLGLKREDPGFGGRGLVVGGRTVLACDDAVRLALPLGHGAEQICIRNPTRNVSSLGCLPTSLGNSACEITLE